MYTIEYFEKAFKNARSLKEVEQLLQEANKTQLDSSLIQQFYLKSKNAIEWLADALK